MPSSKNKLSSTQKINSKRPVKSRSDQLLEKRIKQQEENKKKLEDRKAERAFEREQKLMKSFRSLDNYLVMGVFVGLLVDLYVLYLTIKSHGNPMMLAAFVFSLACSLLLIYSSRLFSRKDKRAMTYYAAVFFSTILFLMFTRFMSGASLFMLKDIVSYLIPVLLLIEMYKLKENGVLE
jgi:hypothetical protein